jgi:hypothetical protein
MGWGFTTQIKHHVTLLGSWVVFMGPTIDLRIKTPDVGMPVLHTKFEVKETKHNFTVE